MKLKLHEFLQKAISDFQFEKGINNMWKPSLEAVVPADHPLIPSLKQAVSPDHLLPGEILPGAKSIIVFFIPFESRIITSNLKGEAASPEWAQAYILTNSLLSFISDELEKFFNQQGFRVGKIKATHNFDPETLMSRWSHRHIARIAGLGCFGINNMLITSSGCCGRFCSILTDASCRELEEQFGFPVVNNYLSFTNEKCLYKINGSCGICQKKCPSGAYQNGVFDRYKCYEACLKNSELYKSIGLADVCGKCLVGLPCSTRDPSANQTSRA